MYKTAKDFAVKHLKYAEYTTDLFDDYFALLFAEYLNRTSVSPINPVDLPDFLRPATLSASAEYHKQMLRLSFLKIKRMPKPRQIAERYSWIQMSWDGSNELIESDLRREIVQLRKLNVVQRRKEIDSLKNYHGTILKKRQGLLKKYQIRDRNIKNYFYLLDKFNVFHDYRKEIQMRSNQVIYRVLKETSKRFKIRLNNLMFYLPEEIEQLLLHNICQNLKLIRKRQKGLTWLIQEGRVREYLGKDANDKLEKLVLQVMQSRQTQEIKGLTASKGVAKGRVFMARSAKEANKMLKRGEILVVPQTTVDYLPAMKRARAIVTDDGGVTCHAAIVSRELGIPCVVGTKVASRVLKTGDKIKIDANQGVVTVIKRK